MSRFMNGVMLILAFLLMNTFAALIVSGSASTTTAPGCTTSNNFTTCQNVSKTTFLSALFAVTVTGVSGAPDVFNIIYVILSGTLLVAGVLLVVISFVPTLGN